MFLLHTEDDLETLDLSLVSPDDPQTAWNFATESLVHVEMFEAVVDDRLDDLVDEPVESLPAME